MSTTGPGQLDGPSWRIVESAFTEVTDEHSGKITFADNTIRLNAPCNAFASRIMVHGDGLTIFPFENMPNTCGVAAMEVEGAMKRALLRVAKFEISGNTLILRSVDGTQMIRAVR